ncbi:adenosylcobinamide amidohydrolase [Celeribacter indicus]|uniref:Adenosylcobinamide amidohydrolase n=1 Tax=Celeribacter indicus TaxID=1208324 RepID=A0A0B5E342_9RHOB|nr:adenosylcobinamide amidohydrolase [Celeribacter indicus]AJE47805.1 adenosylcobinamide amidohydrolase [Celeribacter indicus]SDW23484.1 adenosylcobinamide hydrolase [Celeribacter indicus]
MTGPALRLARPWLEMRFAAPREVLSWTLNRPGFVTADRLLWREVCNADLTPELDVADWLAGELAAQDMTDAPCFLTSRDIRRMVETRVTVDQVTARCVATVGLSNGERIGARRVYDPASWGTINIAVELDLPLARPALIEALSLVAEARTAALVELGPDLETGRITGTGTDCIAVAAPEGEMRFAGLHTAQGEALGRAVHDAVATGTRDWIGERTSS